MSCKPQPRMLLLDEPMAGLGPEESRRMLALSRELKGVLTILLVERDMETVFSLADRITVLVAWSRWVHRRRSGPTPRYSAPISARRRPSVRCSSWWEES